METKYIIAAFNVDQEKSVFYRKYKKIESVTKKIEELLKSNKVDYISFRVINRLKQEVLDKFLEEEE